MVSTEPAAPPTQPPVSTSALRSCLGLAAAVLLWGRWVRVGGSAIAALVVAVPILSTVRRRGR